MKKEAILAKIKAEPDQDKRFLKKVLYIIEHGSAEEKKRMGEILDAALEA